MVWDICNFDSVFDYVGHVTSRSCSHGLNCSQSSGCVGRSLRKSQLDWDPNAASCDDRGVEEGRELGEVRLREFTRRLVWAISAFAQCFKRLVFRTRL
mmetsp:Transcript_19413/g.51080  ORF Transcript_19413/g.51080 Transcript_19413/m.51080 type:complete len:98 (-) Transcript_19413:1901-2194(-)